MGFRGQGPRNTLAKANGRRDRRIHADFARSLIRTARDLYAGDGFGASPGNTVHAPGSTTGHLCLPVFPRAHFRRTGAAVRMHTLLDLHGGIHVSDRRPHDVNVLDMPVPEAGRFHVMDRACPGFGHLHDLHLRGGFPVLRAKPDTNLRCLPSRPVDRGTDLICGQVVRPDGVSSATRNAAGP